ncbi:hypothetical protein SASPL_157224 [Salvia splendens]|uniref:Nodulin homeobox N-terminal domain-containing protein n=1 Tax=Salvia splendens TaxID=180675 RepID=A0A8X8YUJ7_SALSN|nr:hypothetical protein SASPL_157224 [Salvia splendens]
MQSLSGALLSIQSASSDLPRSSRSTSATKLSGLTMLLSLAVCFMDYINIGTGFTTMRRETPVELLQHCEVESVSYLDEVASNTATQDMAHSVGLEFLQLCEAESVSYLDELASNGNSGYGKVCWTRGSCIQDTPITPSNNSLQGKLPEGAT